MKDTSLTIQVKPDTGVKDAGGRIVLGNPDWGVIIARQQPQDAQRHVGAASGGAGRNHFGTRPTTADGIERQRQIGIVLVRVVALYLKGFGGIDQRTAGITHRVGIPHIHVTAQSRAQKCVEPAVHGDNVVALPRSLT